MGKTKKADETGEAAKGDGSVFGRGIRFRKWRGVLRSVYDTLGKTEDFVIRTLVVKGSQRKVYLLYLKSITDKTVINEYIVEPIINGFFELPDTSLELDDQYIREISLSSVDSKELVRRILQALVSSQCVVADVEQDRILFIPCSLPQHRQVEETDTEPVIRGPHEGFTESLETNVALIRKRIHNPFLRLEPYYIGDETQTKVLLIYLANVAPDNLVQEARRRLLSIKTDSILESSYIEEFIQDNMFTVFPTLVHTEKPDVVAARLLEGKVAFMVEGTSNVIMAPVTFFEFFNSPEDYYQRADIATFVRFIRIISFFIAVFVPSIYVAAMTFHPELLPTALVISLASQQEGVPLPTLGEALVMEIIFEIIREAGLRMPRAIGQALSIVGAIVLGQAAVQAGLISAAVVIVVAVTGIANFVVPTYSFGIAQRLLRFTFLLLAGFMGLFGVLCGVLFLLAHLLSLESFKVPYMAPAVPFHFSDLKDTFLRLPRPFLGLKRLPQYMLNMAKKR